MHEQTSEALPAKQSTGQNVIAWVAMVSILCFALGMVAGSFLFPTPAIAEQLAPVEQRIEQLGQQIAQLSAQWSEAQTTLAGMRGVDWNGFNDALGQVNERLEHAESMLNEMRQGSTAAEEEAPSVSADDDPALGVADAPVLIVEFSDYQCPFCKRFETETLPQIIQSYVDTGKVRLVFRDFPLTQIHANALPAALASECADEQEKFWPYHDLLFAQQSDWAQSADIKAMLIKYAVDLELDENAFAACFESNRYLEEVQHDFSDGVSYGVNGTPTFFINGKKLVGALPFNQFQTAIEAALAED